MSEPSANPNPQPNPNPAPASPAAPKPAAAKPAAAMTRGDFLWLGWSTLAAFFAASAAAGARFFFPNVIYEPSQKFNAGPAASYDQGVSTKWLNEQRMWIIRTPSGIYALWARCTHLGCTPNWWGDQNRFKCPCHGSNYTMAGDVIAGPAPRPLWRAKIELSPLGDLIVDKSVLEDMPGKRELAPFFVPFASA
jgi:cytochrome b6-f complex iron-sulfur subunit